MKYYYANAQNQPTGPVSVDELRGLLASGSITPATNVIPEGGQQWAPLSSLPELAQAAAPTPAPAQATGPNASTLLLNGPTFLADIVGVALEKARGILTEEVLRRTLSSATTSGQVLVLAGALLGFLSCLIQAFKPNQLSVLFIGIAGVVFIALLQYVSKKFFQGCRQLIENSPSTMGSAAVLDCIALMCLATAVFLLLGGTVYSIMIRGQQLPTLLTVVSGALGLTLLGMVALNAKVANISIAPASAGEEAMGILSFLIKIPVILVPISFFTLSLLGSVACLVSLFQRTPNYDDPSFGMGGPLMLLQLQGGGALAGIGLLAIASLLPFLVYCLFLLQYLGVDVIRSIVCLPAKVDALKNK